MNMSSLAIAALALATTAQASDTGKNCASAPLSPGVSVTACRGLRSSTYSTGGFELQLRYVYDGHADCRTPLDQISPVTLWLRAGRGEAILTAAPLNDPRAVPVKIEIARLYDGSDKCAVFTSYEFSAHDAKYNPDESLRRIHEAIMADVSTDVEFAIGVPGAPGEIHRLHVEQYGGN